MPNTPPRLIEYASLLSYVSPKRWLLDMPDSKRRDLIVANNYTLALKNNHNQPDTDRRVYDYVAQTCAEQRLFPRFFSGDVTLVPVPGSCPHEPGSMWAPELLACALEKHGLGCKIVSYLERTEPVRKSSHSPGNRLTPTEHHNTMVVQRRLTAPARILLVDDVVTAGATFLGSAWLMKEAYPDIEIKAFAAMRTISQMNQFKKLECPCTGILKLNRDMESWKGPCQKVSKHTDPLI